jgi:hypothetical protein
MKTNGKEEFNNMYYIVVYIPSQNLFIFQITKRSNSTEKNPQQQQLCFIETNFQSVV